MANTFSTSQIIDEVKKVKSLSHIAFSDGDGVAKKMDKVELTSAIDESRYDIIEALGVLNKPPINLKEDWHRSYRTQLGEPNVDYSKYLCIFH